MREGFEEDFGRRGGQRVEEMHLKLEGRKNREEISETVQLYI